MGHEIKRLQGRHLKILELVLQGIGNKEIAQLTGMSEVGIGGIVRAPLFQERLSIRQKRREQIMDSGHYGGISAAKELIDEQALERVTQLAAIADGELVIDNDHQAKAIHKLLDLAFGDKQASAAGPLGGQVFQVNAEKLEFFMQVVDEDRGLRNRAGAGTAGDATRSVACTSQLHPHNEIPNVCQNTQAEAMPVG